ncbi:hypothetical protein [Sphingomonas lenta]|uniref:Uncharacterized protein n=1 Tax=Sphingomonas lenta TaxID=1141887 RepID=A0A2A2SCM3_9SPHN|nr:hypothetical protein [Sphingomonas lenta]PAX06751.1 hypothetical protein CKY28_16655 [Sphingomonas lenta]
MFAHIFAAVLTTAAIQPLAVTIDGAGEPIDLTYDARPDVRYRQLGAVAPPGRPSSLRCAWSADMRVARRAERRGVPLASLSRDLAKLNLAEGSRHGWCAQVRAGVEREVAGMAAAAQPRVREVVARDQASVSAELRSLTPPPA